MSDPAREVNFDGLIGPTHNYAGLAIGNVASADNAGEVSNPRDAALQGLSKMRAVLDLGVLQGFIPPPRRPDLRFLRAVGFTGDDAGVLGAAARADPGLLANAYSASAMWTANAATIAPSRDTADGRVHITPANLAAHLHRALEACETAATLDMIFPDKDRFARHDPLPAGVHFGDEGAANHGRLAERHAGPGVHLFVYGEDGARFPARQRRAASEAVARLHGVAPERRLLLKQSRAALDAGAFHNDVVCVANENVLFLHEQTFEDRDGALGAVRAAAPFVTIVEAGADAVSLQDAVGAYLFNSQLLTLPDGSMALLLPREAEENAASRAFLQRTLDDDNPIDRLIFKDVRESMRNGGGPACLRLRVVLNDAERAATDQRFFLTPDRIAKLETWVRAHYRDRLAPADLADPALMRESFAARDALDALLNEDF
ncbi:MAG: N-succinylarginine dihydrolase [Pseudomonadota bacterium]